MPAFIPPFELGTFKPSAASLASWLYEIWKYLQQNPIPNDAELTAKVTEIVPPEVAAYMEEHPATVQSVNGLVGAVVIAYADLVSGSTVPVFRTTTIESTQTDLLEAWDEGCRFTVIDDTNVYVMLYSEPGGTRTITLLPCGGGGGGGIQSINTTVLPDGTGNAVLTSQEIPLSTLDPTTISTQLSNMVTAINGKASQNDLTTLAGTVAGKADNTAFTGATSTTPGSAGLVPQPGVGVTDSVLKSSGAWAQIGVDNDELYSGAPNAGVNLVLSDSIANYDFIGIYAGCGPMFYTQASTDIFRTFVTNRRCMIAYSVVNQYSQLISLVYVNDTTVSVYEKTITGFSASDFKLKIYGIKIK